MSEKKKPLEVKCPVCQSLARWEGNPFRPFCGERCKMQDLGNWAMGKYRIAGDHSAESEPDEVPAPKTPSWKKED